MKKFSLFAILMLLAVSVMGAGLDFDVNKPLNSATVSSLPGYIRETRSDIYDFAIEEHLATGVHALPSSTTGGLTGETPSGGRLIYNSTTGALLYGTGSAWVGTNGAINVPYSLISTYSDNLTTAVVAISSNKVTLVIDRATSLSAHTIVPKTLRLVFIGDGQVTLGNYNLALNCEVIAPQNAKIFNYSGAGAVAFGGIGSTVSILPDWFGAVGDGVADDYAYVLNTVNSLSTNKGKILITHGKIFSVGSELTVPSTISLEFLNGQIRLGAFNLITSGRINAPLTKIFDLTGAGQVRRGSGGHQIEIYPEWFGTNTAALAAAIGYTTSHIATVRLTTGFYPVTSSISTIGNAKIVVDDAASISISVGITFTLQSVIIPANTTRGPPLFVGAGSAVLGSDFFTNLGGDNQDVRLYNGTYNVVSDLTSPVNISLSLSNGAVLAPATTKILTISGPLKAGLYQIFSCVGTGKVALERIDTVYPEWWGITGVDDHIAINAAFQATPIGSTLKLLPKIYNLNDVFLHNRNVAVKGSGLCSALGGGTNPGSLLIPANPGTVLDFSGFIGAGSVAYQMVATQQEYLLSDLWVYGGLGNIDSAARIGVDIPTNVSRYTLKNVRVSGFTRDRTATVKYDDATGAGIGIRANGSSNNFSGVLENVQTNYNDVAIMAGDRTQHLKLEGCKIIWSYSRGLDLLDNAVVLLLNCQIEKNGSVADTTASVYARGVSGLSLIGCYGEQNNVWPGAAMICEGGINEGYTDGVFIDSASNFIGNQDATKGVILKKCKNFYNYGLFANFTTANISYEPAATLLALENIHDYNRRYLSSVGTFPETMSLQNYISNPFMQKWWSSSDLVGWTKSTEGTLARSTDAGAINAIGAELAGAGVLGEVSITQNIMPAGLYFGNQSKGFSVWVYVKCPTTNTVTSYINANGNSASITKSDSWQWKRVGKYESAAVTSFSVKAMLCLSTATPAVTDKLLIGYVGVFPGWAFPEGPIGEVDLALYGSATFDPTPGTQDTITVAGAAVGDGVVVFPPYDTVAASVTGSVTAPNTVKVLTLGTNLGSGLWRVKVLKQ